MSLFNCVLVNKTSAQEFTRATGFCNQALWHSEGIVHTMSVRLKNVQKQCVKAYIKINGKVQGTYLSRNYIGLKDTEVLNHRVTPNR